MVCAEESTAYLGLSAVRRFNVIHDVDMDVVEDNTLLRHSGPLPKDTTEDDASFRG